MYVCMKSNVSSWSLMHTTIENTFTHATNYEIMTIKTMTMIMIGTLLKRSENRAKAEAELAAAKENDDVELINKFESRLVKVGKKENDECKQLLRLMG